MDEPECPVCYTERREDGTLQLLPAKSVQNPCGHELPLPPKEGE